MDSAPWPHLPVNLTKQLPMRIWFTITLVVLPFLGLQAQDRVVEGWLNDSDGSPLAGVNVVVKGTIRGTTTDVDGHYSISAPVGSTLVFSFIGMVTREEVVTADNFQQPNASPSFSTNLKPFPRALFLDSVTGRGVAVLNESTPVYDRSVHTSPSWIRSIRSIRKRGNAYYVRAKPNAVRMPLELQFTTAFGLEHITRLPHLQSTYAQGRPVNGNLSWQGADQREMFSWGPRVDALEYDGSAYAYDSHGRLVGQGTGNGQAARSFGIRPFFKTALTSANELVMQLGRRDGHTIIDIEQRNRRGIMPGTGYDRLNAMIRMNGYQVFNIASTDVSVAYNRSAADLPAHGGNLAAVMGGLLTTPATFNNKEGFRTSDGSIRSYAPGLADNPWGIVHEFPDRDVLDRTAGAVKLTSTRWGRTSFAVSGDAEIQRSKTRFGTPPAYSAFTEGRLTERREDQHDFHGVFSSKVRPSLEYPNRFTINSSYQVHYVGQRLQRTDALGFGTDNYGDTGNGSATIINDRRLHRTTQEVVLNASYERDDWLRVSAGNQVYFSNTAAPGTYTNFFPSASVKVDMVQALQIYDIGLLEVYGVASRLPREAPLIYGNWSYTSLNTRAERYATAYESAEIYMWRGLRPEIVNKMETGIRFNARPVSADICFYNNNTDNFIAPVWDNGTYRLANAAAIVNRGTTISISYDNNDHWSGEYTWGVKLAWSRYTNKVDRIYTQADYVPLAGFSDIQTVLAPGKPVGAIYGSAYARNADGAKIIGSDGFPLHDTSLRMIGNPLPDWMLGWSAFIKRDPVSLSFVFDFRKGGEVWNGTRAALDYLGRSAATGTQRSTTGYVFAGVTTEGIRNTTPVNFADAAQPVENNRWVRYGWSGVGEDYTEDASWIRLSELNVSYTIERKDESLLRQLKFTLAAHNLFIITPYSGVDPATSLFGYSAGRGLDLFNIPSVRSYSAQLTLKI